MALLHGLDWVVLLLLIALFYYPLSGMRAEGRYYALYRQAQKRHYAGFPPMASLGAVWWIVYGLLVAAVFVFYLKADGCVVHNALYAHADTCWTTMSDSMYTVVWILILVNWWALKMGSAMIKMSSLNKMRVGGALWSLLFAFGTAVAIAILFYVDSRFFPAIVYTVLSVWLLYASYLAWMIYANYKRLCECALLHAKV